MRTNVLRRVPSAMLALALAAAVVTVPSAPPAEADTSGSWTYAGSRVTGYDGPGGHVTIPSELGGQTITEIAWSAFEGNEDITHVTVPNTVETIYESAFEDAVNLVQVDLPDSLTTIDAWAFRNTGLTSIDLPDSLTTLASGAFEGAADLEVHVDIPDSVTHLGQGVFAGSGITSFDLPAGLTEIPGSMFSRTPNLTHVTIPDGVEDLGQGTFSGSNISSVDLPDGLKLIGYAAFWATENLGDVTLPDSVTEIGAQAFFESGLTGISMPASLTKMGDGAFWSTPNLATDVVIPGGLTVIPDRTFEESAITSVTLSEGVESIGNRAFMGAGITSVDLPDSLTSVGEYAFHEAADLNVDVTIPEGVTSIGKFAFSKSGITSVSLPDSLTSIGDHAFYGTANLNVDVTIPEGVTVITKGLFYESALTGVTLHDGIETIEDNAFYGNRLDSITIPASVTDVGQALGWGAQKKTGRTFAGWHTEPQPAGVPGVYAGESVNFGDLGGADVTIYTHWAPLQVTLHGGATDVDLDGLPTTVTYGDSVTFSAPMRPEYVFLGWSTVASPDAGDWLIGPHEEFVMVGDVELYAQWAAAEHSITLYPNGDDVTMLNLPGGASHGEVITIGAPVREGFSFAGWATTAEPDEGEVLLGPEDEYVVLGDVELYAQWTTATYSVTFNDGVNAAVTEQASHGSSLTEPERVVNPQHKFAGWFTGDGIQWDFDENVVLGDLILEAMWVPREVQHGSKVYPGGTLTIEAEGFEPDDTVTVTLGEVDLGTFSVSDEGTLSVELEFPKDATAGAHTLIWHASVTGPSATNVEVLSMEPDDGDDNNGGDNGISGDAGDGDAGKDESPSLDDLTEATKGGIAVTPTTVKAGEVVRATADYGEAGDSVVLYLFSEPLLLGEYVLSDALDVTVQIPADTPVGEHRFAMFSLDGEVIGWETITVEEGSAAAGGDGAGAAGGDALPRTGFDNAGLVAAAGGLILAGLALAGLGIRSRRKVEAPLN